MYLRFIKLIKITHLYIISSNKILYQKRMVWRLVRYLEIFHPFIFEMLKKKTVPIRHPLKTTKTI